MHTILIYLQLFFASFAFGQQENLVRFSAQSFTYNDKKILAINYENQAEWHTYWKNPGDAGLPINISFEVGEDKVSLKEYPWPAPKRVIEGGDMLAYSLNGAYTFFFELDKKFASQRMIINSHWLVCKHICVPGQGKISLKIDNDLNTTQESGENITLPKDELTSRLQALPKTADFPLNLDLVFTTGEKENSLELFYNISHINLANMSKDQNILTPYPNPLFDFKRESLFLDTKGNLFARFQMDWNGEYLEPKVPFPSDGKFSIPVTLKFLFQNLEKGEIQIIEKSFSSINLDARAGLIEFTKMLSPISENSSPPSLKEKKVEKIQEKNSLLYYLLLAFIGGLILNIMPCVLPVISLKLFALLKDREYGPKKVFFHNIIYSLGIITTFLLFGLIISLLKNTTEGLGWGFQLQSPLFVSFMVIILFIFSLNMFDLYQFKTPGGKKLGSLNFGNGPLSDFFGGVIATILSTPCSAPFLGTALTFAFSSGPFVIFLIFFFIGFGMALPFILTAFFPRLIHFLPQPGKWMNDIKKFLGLTLLLTTIWLFDIYLSLTDIPHSSLKILTLLSLIFFYFYTRATITKKRGILIPFFLLIFSFSLSIFYEELNPQKNETSKNALIKWEKWSPELLEKYKNEGKVVFIDFTADWCFTCKINESLVIKTKSFEEIVKKYELKLLLADWTRRDPIIANWLKSHDKVGVPAYFIQKENGEIKSLGETLSIREIENSLK